MQLVPNPALLLRLSWVSFRRSLPLASLTRCIHPQRASALHPHSTVERSPEYLAQCSPSALSRLAAAPRLVRCAAPELLPSSLLRRAPHWPISDRRLRLDKTLLAIRNFVQDG